MAFSVLCRDIGFDCPAQFRGDSEEAVRQQAEQHAAEEHPDFPLDETTLHKLQAVMKVV